MLTTKKITTAKLRIDVAIPPENPEVTGHFFGVAKIRTRPESEALQKRIKAENLSDEQVVRELYESFEGLGNDQGPCTGEDAFNEVLNGNFSGYLPTAVIKAYFEQYGEAKQGNLNRSRGR